MFRNTSSKRVKQGYFKPNLFDRLVNREIKDTRVVGQRLSSDEEYRQSVTQNLMWLLNSVSLEAEIDFAHAPYVKESVINFGIKSFTGKRIAGLRFNEMCDEIKYKISIFEPRILKDTLQVKVVNQSKGNVSYQQCSLLIEGEIISSPTNISLLIESKINLDDTKMYMVEGR